MAMSRDLIRPINTDRYSTFAGHPDHFFRDPFALEIAIGQVHGGLWKFIFRESFRIRTRAVAEYRYRGNNEQV